MTGKHAVTVAAVDAFIAARPSMAAALAARGAADERERILRAATERLTVKGRRAYVVAADVLIGRTK